MHSNCLNEITAAVFDPDALFLLGLTTTSHCTPRRKDLPTFVIFLAGMGTIFTPVTNCVTVLALGDLLQLFSSHVAMMSWLGCSWVGIVKVSAIFLSSSLEDRWWHCNQCSRKDWSQVVPFSLQYYRKMGWLRMISSNGGSINFKNYLKTETIRATLHGTVTYPLSQPVLFESIVDDLQFPSCLPVVYVIFPSWN